MENANILEKKISALNIKASKSGKLLNYPQAYNYLDQAIAILLGLTSLHKENLTQITYNNYGNLLKQQGDYEKALKFFYKIAAFPSQSPVKLGEAYLQICKVYSKMSNHESALDFSIKALNLLKKSESSEKIVAFQNVGVEYEYLGLVKEAIRIYKKGYKCALEIFGSEHRFVKMFRSRFEKLSEGRSEKSLGKLRESGLKMFFVSKNQRAVYKSEPSRQLESLRAISVTPNGRRLGRDSPVRVFQFEKFISKTPSYRNEKKQFVNVKRLFSERTCSVDRLKKKKSRVKLLK